MDRCSFGRLRLRELGKLDGIDPVAISISPSDPEAVDASECTDFVNDEQTETGVQQDCECQCDVKGD